MLIAENARMNADHTPAFVPHRLLEITGGDTELFGDLMAEFRTNMLEYARDLRAAPDRAVWRATAHRLKGAAQSIGAEAIAEAAVLAELSAPGDRSVLARLDVEVQRFSTF